MNYYILYENGDQTFKLVSPEATKSMPIENARSVQLHYRRLHAARPDAGYHRIILDLSNVIARRRVKTIDDDADQPVAEAIC